jgi:hypothetical protein
MKRSPVTGCQDDSVYAAHVAPCFILSAFYKLISLALATSGHFALKLLIYGAIRLPWFRGRPPGIRAVAAPALTGQNYDLIMN